MFKEILKNKYFWIILGITALGFFLRAYRLGDLLFFEIDQARDWKIVKLALEDGFANFPLLGPKFGGTDASLGSAFYFFVYVSGLLFGSSPEKLLYFELFLSVLTIPFSYFFFKEFFSKQISTSLCALFAVSLFAIEYSRFSWNPNTVPFFVLLTFFSLLRLSREKSPRKTYFWSFLLGLGLGIGTQLHSATLFGLPLIVGAFLIWVRPKIKFRNWALVVGLFFLAYIPMFLHEYAFEMRNSKEFLKAVSQKSEKQAEHTKTKRAVKHFHELTKNYSVILTSADFVRTLDQTRRSSFGTREMLVQNLKGKENRRNVAFSVAFFLFFLLSALKVAQKWKQLPADEVKKRNALKLLVAWQLVALFLTISFTFNPDSRLYLTMVFIPYILLGVWLEDILKIKNKGIILAAGIVVFLFAFNLLHVKKWFLMVEGYTYLQKQGGREYVLEDYFSVTWKQYSEIMSHIQTRQAQEGKIVGIDSSPFFVRPVRHFLEYELNLPVERLDVRQEDSKIYFFFDKISLKEESLDENLRPKLVEFFDIKETMTFGNVVLFELFPKETYYPEEDPLSVDDFFSQKEEEDEEYTWGHFYSTIGKTQQNEKVGFMKKAKNEDGLKIGFLTDAHCYKNNKATVFNYRCLDPLNYFFEKMNTEFKPDFVIDGGDLVEGFGDKEKRYDEFVELVDIYKGSNISPVYFVMGNHEIRDFTKEKWEEATGNKSHYYFDIKGYRIVVLDGNFLPDLTSATPEKRYVPGAISEKQLEWLDEVLEKAEDLRKIIFIHQPPLEVTVGREKGQLLYNARDLREILSKNGVLAVFSGHIEEVCHLQIDDVNYFVTKGLHKFHHRLPLEQQYKNAGAFSEITLNGDLIEVAMYYKNSDEKVFNDSTYQKMIINQETAFCNNSLLDWD